MPGATTESASSTISPVVVRKVSPDETYGYARETLVRVVGAARLACATRFVS